MSDKVDDSVRLFVAKEQLMAADALHIVALSGGADSVALLLILKRLGYRVEAAHCNFHLRGEESDRDEQFVVSLCHQENVPLHLIHFDTTTYASLHQVSIEMAARELRYHYFEQLRQDIGAADVCVAHHQDDAVETLLMNLVRGTGIHGLTGIRPRNGHVVRPLLCLSRADIVSFLEAAGQDYVTDSTNLVPDVVRNKIRLEVLPLLRQINPAASENIAKAASRMAEAEKVFNHFMQASVAELFKDGCVEIEQLMKQPSPECLLHELLSPLGFTSAQVEQVFGGLTGPSGRIFQSPTHDVAIDRGRLIVEERGHGLDVNGPAVSQPTSPRDFRVPEPGVYHYADGVKFRFEVSEGANVSKAPDLATLDADKVVFPLTIRPVQTGDRFQPFGMTGSRLVSDYLTDCKCSVFDKRRQLVLTDATARILWLVRRRTDQRFAVDAATRHVLTIQVSKIVDSI